MESHGASPELPHRIGVFGGTFDPPHIGHLVAALGARHELGLDVVLMVVANEPWQKVGLRTLSSAGDRLAMTALAVAGVPGLDVCAIEVGRPGPTYTVDTLTQLREMHPGAELVLLLGGDAAAGLPTWHRPELVRDLATLAVILRPPRVTDTAPPDWPHITVDSPLVDLSSSELRARARNGRPLDFLVPEAVCRYIVDRNLYGGVP